MALVAGVAGLTLAIGVAGPALAETGYPLERQWGSQGTGDGQFGAIGGVATDVSGPAAADEGLASSGVGDAGELLDRQAKGAYGA